ncbi:hypothetical protein EPO05_05760 [Patescibacteria group bacterium]|nr:MAG: hypothetical protein EPO05_05760 [Patescibacteria group bacterium]
MQLGIIMAFTAALSAWGCLAFWSKDLQSLEKHRQLIGALEAAENHEYNNGYQCLDFSKSLAEKFQQKGIESRIEIVKQKDSDSYHAVVSLQIEPQNGSVVSYESVDSCRLVDGELACEGGIIKEKNLYVAGRSE